MFTGIYSDKAEANERLQILLKTGIPMSEDEAIALCGELDKRMAVLIGENHQGQQYKPGNRSPMNYALGDLLGQFCIQVETRLDADQPVVLCDPPSVSIDTNNPNPHEDAMYGSIFESFKQDTEESAYRRMKAGTAKSVPESLELPKHISSYTPAEMSEDSWLANVHSRYDKAIQSEASRQAVYQQNQYRLLATRLDLEIYNCLADALGADRDRLEVKRPSR